MDYLVNAELEIDGEKIEHFSSIRLKQGFNEHHEFTIKLDHDIIESSGSFSLSKAQENIGKSTLIRLLKSDIASEVAYEFRGIICEIRLEQSGRSNSDLILFGYSPTIVLENGRTLTSFYKSDLKKIVQKISDPLSSLSCNINIHNQYTKPITYICQYRESNFQFLNRLSSDYSEHFFYDGKEVNFGKPSSSKTMEVTYGEDISSMELALRISPLTFSNYAYLSKDDKVEKIDAPRTVEGLGEYASHVVKESNNIFSEPFTFPIKPRVESRSDLENFAKKMKASMAAELETLTGSSLNPEMCIGGTIDVKISRIEMMGNSFVKEDYGKFLVTRIEHFITENGKYYNTFEAIPAEFPVIPVSNVIVPVAEPQIAVVKDNNDPDKMGRVRAQMLWQKGAEQTDWIRVMTPDAGGGKGGAKNRGLVVIPEVGDQVLICFRYNDPDRPFVMGSMFHGKSGGGGGSSNKSKSLTALSGSIVLLDGDAITIKDAKDNFINLDGTGNITIKSSESIVLNCGDSSVSLKKDGTIEIKGKDISISGSSSVKIDSDTLVKLDSKANVEIKGTAGTSVKSDAKAELSSPATTVEGTASAKVKGAMVDIEGTAMTNVKGGIVNLN